MFIHPFLRPALLLAALPLVSCVDNAWTGSLTFVQQYNWNYNGVWPVGTQQKIGWTTNFTDYYISLWQHDVDILGIDQRDIGRIFNSTSIAGVASGPQTFTWDVTLDLNTPASPPNLLSSPVFFLWLFEITSDGSTGGQFGSYAFNITQDTSTSTKSPDTSTSAVISSSTAISSSPTTLSSAFALSSTLISSSASSSSSASTLGSVSTLTSAFTPGSTSTTTTSGTSSSAIDSPSHQGIALALKIGLGVGLGLGIPLLLIVGGLIGWKAFGRRRKVHHTSGDPYVISTRQSPNALPGYGDFKQYKTFYDNDVALQQQSVAHDVSGYGDVHEMNAYRPPAELGAGDR